MHRTPARGADGGQEYDLAASFILLLNKTHGRIRTYILLLLRGSAVEKGGIAPSITGMLYPLSYAGNLLKTLVLCWSTALSLRDDSDETFVTHPSNRRRY